MSNPSRTDAFVFYGIAAVSFLESTVATYVDNLSPFFPDNPTVREWLERVWLPEEAEHGHLTRQYVQNVWPEFDWEEGYSLFLQSYRPRCDHQLLRPSPALEALARCVTEAETTMIYRCLAAYVTDPELRALMHKMSTDEVRHYTSFRKVFDRYDRVERNSIWRKATTVVSRSQLVRDEDIALAFASLNDCWYAEKPFQSMHYNEFLSVAGRVMARHFPLEEAKRMLFRPLRTGRWFEKILVSMLATVVRRQYPHVA